MNIETNLIEILKSAGAGAFLFVGSGFSRRYLGLEDWRSLLSKFSVAGRPFEYYLASANGDMPLAAKLLAIEFNEYWWKAPEYSAHVDRYKSKIRNSTSALRLEISLYLAGLDKSAVEKSGFSDEIKLLSSLNVDGIITTNWDLFIEQLFPDYKKYIGQNELLFANPQEIGEIYKIHGCASKPESLILTSDDYATFQERNPYLAAKLITVFVEHPVIFLGYSISDPNIVALLRAVSLCIGKDQIEKLRKNLIFVQRMKDDETEGISDTFLTIEGVQIPIVLVRTREFSEVYRALAATRRKIPARVLRYCKEQLYELVKSLEPEKKLCVVDIDAIDQKDDIEFLVGVGVSSHAIADIGSMGYEAIDAMDLISDILHDNKDYDAIKIVESVIKRAGRNTKYVPIFKYLRKIGILNKEDLAARGLQLEKWTNHEQSDFQVNMHKATFFKRRHLSLQELIESSTPENAAALIPFLAKEKINLEMLLEFLKTNEEKMDSTASSYASNFRKLAVLYDKLKFGWH